MSHYTKKATQIVGLAVAKTPRETLIDLYSKTLSVLGTMPQTSLYRQQAEEITKERLGTVQKEENVFKIEKQINCGQIEEVIVQANDELSLAEKVNEWKPWEHSENTAPLGQWS